MRTGSEVQIGPATIPGFDVVQTKGTPSNLGMELPQAFKILREMKASQSPSWRFLLPRPVAMPEKWQAACELVELSPPEAVLPGLASVIWDAETSVSPMLLRIFITHAKSLPLNEWAAFDESVRSYHYHYGDVDPAVLEQRCTRSSTCIIVALCHPFGRIRERALPFARRLEPRIASALLALRMNDWVELVRKRASSELDRTLRALAAVDKMAVVPLLIRLRESGRHRQPEKLDAWMDVLASPFAADAWLETWTSAHGRNRVGYLEILRRSGYRPDRTMRLELLASNDRRALFWFIEHLPSDVGRRVPGRSAFPDPALADSCRQTRMVDPAHRSRDL